MGSCIYLCYFINYGNYKNNLIVLTKMKRIHRKFSHLYANTHVLNFSAISDKNINNGWINCHFDKSTTTKPQLYSTFPNVLWPTIQRAITTFQPFMSTLLHRIKENSMESNISVLLKKKNRIEPVHCHDKQIHRNERQKKKGERHSLWKGRKFYWKLKSLLMLSDDRFLNDPQFFEISRSPVTLHKHYICRQQTTRLFQRYTW